MSFLRPAKLLETLGPGDTVPLSILELRVEGPAQVLAVDPCPPIDGGAGRIVTGAFHSQSVDVRLLKLEGLDAPIEVTGNHPVFSEDRLDFVSVDALNPGERLRTRQGVILVESVEKKFGRWEVFNLEIDDAHRYYVSDRSLLVHNAGPNGVIGSGAQSAAAQTNGQLVQEIAERADAWGVRQGLGNGPVAGTLKHGYAEQLLDRYQSMFGSRGLSTEVRYLNGAEWQSGMPLKGSIRLDVVEGPLNNPTLVWDYKFGNALLTPARVSQIRTGAGLGPAVPVDAVRP
jgi:hypothetical protein